MGEVAKHLGDLGTFGIFVICVLIVLFKYGIPALRAALKPENEARPVVEAAPPRQEPAHQGVDALALFRKISDKLMALALIQQRLDDLDEKLEIAVRSREELHQRVDEQRETCAAEHGRPVGK